MNNISGQGAPSDPVDPFSFLDEGTSAILNGEGEYHISEDASFGAEINGSIKEIFVASLKDLSNGPIHVSPLISKNNIKTLDKEETVALHQEKHVVIVFKRYANGDVSITVPEDKKEIFEKQGLILHRKGPNNTEKIEDLRDRKIVYIGVNNEQYGRIFSAANRMITLAAEEYEKNRKKHEEGDKHSFYNRPRFYEKLDLSREWKKLVSKITDSEFAKKIKNLKNQIITSNTAENTREKNEKAREEEYEKKMEFYEEQDKKRGIIKEYNNKEDLRASNDKQEGVEDEHLG